MSEREEILFMQTRLIRLAAEEWKLSMDKVLSLFKQANVLDYIEKAYGIFPLLQRREKLCMMIQKSFGGQVLPI